MFRYPFRLPFRHPFRAAFSLPGFGEIVPPVPDALLIQLKGNDDGAKKKLDGHKKPYAENFDILQSHCVALNGTDEFATLSSAIILSGDFTSDKLGARFVLTSLADHNVLLSSATGTPDGLARISNTGTVQVYISGSVVEFLSLVAELDVESFVSFSRTGTTLTADLNGETESQSCLADDLIIAYVGRREGIIQRFSGKVYDITVGDHHFRLAEGPADGTNLTSFSDNYETDGLYITWTGIPANMWAQRQNTYHGNARLGWWEIDGDLIKYPYPVAGFTTHHKGGTFNNSEAKFAPETKPVGSPNGVDDTFTMLADHGDIVSWGGDGLSTPTYVHPTITFTVGVVRNILFSDGTLLRVDDGEGTVLLGSDMVHIANLGTSDAPAFWAGEEMVSQELMDAEAVQGQNILTDGLGHPVASTQEEWEASLLINENKQHYFCGQLLVYKRVLTESEDIEVKDFLPCWTVSYLAAPSGAILSAPSGALLTSTKAV